MRQLLKKTIYRIAVLEMVILCLFCFSHLAVAHEIDECIIDTTSESNMPVDLVVGNNCSLSSSGLIFYYPEGIDQDSEIVFQILDYDDGLLFTNNGDYSEKDIIYYAYRLNSATTPKSRICPIYRTRNVIY